MKLTLTHKGKYVAVKLDKETVNKNSPKINGQILYRMIEAISR